MVDELLSDDDYGKWWLMNASYDCLF
jgi:hypothetical protein